MEEIVDMAIEKNVLGQLLAGHDPQELFGNNGLLDKLKKAVSERMLPADLDDYLETKAPEAPSIGVTGRRGRQC